jgi:hypothetical protein
VIAENPYLQRFILHNVNVHFEYAMKYWSSVLCREVMRDVEKKNRPFSGCWKTKKDAMGISI